MEIDLKIELTDGREIRGILRKNKKSKGIIIFVHGLAGDKNEHIFFNGSKFFEEKKYDSFRFNLYDDLPNCRKFGESDLNTQSVYLHEIINQLKDHYENIHIIGHSLGCPIILNSLVDCIKSIVFWEPSLEPKEIFRQTLPSRDTKYRLMKARINLPINKSMIKSANQFTPISKLLKKNKVPLKIIGAEKAGFKIGMDLYLINANKPKAFSVIRKSNHFFDEDGAEEMLFKESIKWIERFNK